MNNSRIIAATLIAATAPSTASAEGLKLLSISTLLGEIITFAILIWVVMKFVWPPLMNAVESRQKEIADGLAAGERGRQELKDADARKDELMSSARDQASQLIADGEKRKAEIVDTAREAAEAEKSRILEQGRRDLALERSAMTRELEQKVGELAVSGATQIVGREVDASVHADIIQSLKSKLQS